MSILQYNIDSSLKGDISFPGTEWKSIFEKISFLFLTMSFNASITGV